MRSLICVCLALLVAGCQGHESGDILLDPIAADDEAAAAIDLEQWGTLVEYFAVPAAFGFWYLGDGSDLGPSNDYCSVAYAEGLADDPWAIDAVVSNDALSLETFIVDHMWPMLRSARAARLEYGDAEAEVEASVESLRRVLIRAAFRADEIRRVGESDRFGGYRCIEILTPDGTFMMASGGWS